MLAAYAHLHIGAGNHTEAAALRNLAGNPVAAQIAHNGEFLAGTHGGAYGGVHECDMGTVTTGPLATSVAASGKVEPAFEQIVSSPVASRILEIYVEGVAQVAAAPFAGELFFVDLAVHL